MTLEPPFTPMTNGSAFEFSREDFTSICQTIKWSQESFSRWKFMDIIDSWIYKKTVEKLKTSCNAKEVKYTHFYIPKEWFSSYGN